MPQPQRRRNAAGEESRQRILDAACELAQELGYEGTTIAKLSQRCGLPASSVYWHFENKDALFAEVIQLSFDQWLLGQSSQARRRSGESGRTLLVGQLRETVASYASSPEFWRLGLLLTLGSKLHDPTARARFGEIRRQMIAVVERWWARELGDEADPGLSRHLAQFTMATTDGLFVSSQSEDGWDLDLLANMLTDALLHLAHQSDRGVHADAEARSGTA